jgi:hypothetical protein
MRMARNKRVILVGLLMAVGASAQTTPPAPSGFDWGSELVDWTQQMVTSYGGIFVQDGLTELGWLCALMLMWTWFQWGLNRGLSFARHAHNPLPLPQLVMIFIKTAIFVFFLNHYMVNFPGVGFSFHNWPMAVSKHLVLELNNAPGGPKDQLMAYLQNPTSMIDKPVSEFAIMDNLVYPTVIFWSGVISFGMFVLGGLGFVGSGIFSVIGPVLIPLWLLGGRPAGWAWNWLQVMIAFASYRVIGSVIEYVMASLWIEFIQHTLNGDTSIANWIAHGGILVGLTLFFLLGMTLVPLWAAQIFNGAGAIAQSATSAVSGAVSTVAKIAAAA